MINDGKMYEDAKDIHVTGCIFYAKTASGTTKLYEDSANTVEATGGDVFDAFVANNIRVVIDGAIYNVTSAKVDDGKVYVDILTVASSTATVVTAEAAIDSGDTKTATDYTKIVPAS